LNGALLRGQKNVFPEILRERCKQDGKRLKKRKSWAWGTGEAIDIKALEALKSSEGFAREFMGFAFGGSWGVVNRPTKKKGVGRDERTKERLNRSRSSIRRVGGE